MDAFSARAHGTGRVSRLAWGLLLFAWLVVAYTRRKEIRRFFSGRHVARSISPLDENDERLAGRL